jgi:ATP-dependent Lhr-like helicase
MSLSSFSAATQTWFSDRIGTPTEIQSRAWPEISAGRHVLISAPTGAGKSLAVWTPLLDRLFNPSVPSGALRVLYISPLRALSRDMAEGMLDLLDHPSIRSLSRPPLRIGVRTGDTPASERAHQRRSAPDILLTTPESLFVMLGSRGGRGLLSTVESVIVDEVHALIGDKRGSHLALSLERLDAICSGPTQRVGLSATARPLDVVARFLHGSAEVRIVDWGQPKSPDVRVERPAWPIGHLAGPMHWQFIQDRLIELAGLAGTMLIFCNTRAMVERLAHELGEQLGHERIAGHHGSLGIERRREVEQGLRTGRIEVVVCTSSLELGIDVGPLERVCQIGMSQSINAFRQRAGRARHRPGEVGSIHVFPLSLSDLLDLEATQAAMRSGDFDPSAQRNPDLDVLAQHLIAMVGTGMTRIEALWRLVRNASPFRDLERQSFDAVIEMLHEGYVSGRETGQGPIHRVGESELAPAPLADRLSLVNAGTIPEWFEYEVVDSQGHLLGQLDEEFAFESSPGHIVSLGGQTWRIERVRPGRVEVQACEEAVPDLPFWFGDGAGRSSGLSQQVQHLVGSGGGADPCLRAWLDQARNQLDKLPGPERLVFERFFDPGGDQHLVVHSLFGARLNRAWGLALRKRFCRNFNFELQAAATDNGILISLGAVHSFALDEVAGWLKPDQIKDVLTQAMLDTPIFQTRLRWCANTALAVARRDLQGRVPAQIQRNQTENFIARVFPDQLACLENLSGRREVPEHPLVAQALQDCLEAHMDLSGLRCLLDAIEAGRVEVHCVDRAEPSVLAEAMIHAPQNSFLDPAAAEERRTRSFENRGAPRGLQATLSRPSVALTTREGLMRALIRHAYLTAGEGERGGAARAFSQLVRECRAVVLRPDSRRVLWVALDRLPDLLSLWPRASIGPFLSHALKPEPAADHDDALCRVVVGRLRFRTRIGLADLVGETGLEPSSLLEALRCLETEGLIEGQGVDAERRWRERRPEPVH